MAKPLHIAWLGAGPGAKETGGVPGVAIELLQGLARRGHRIDCFLPGNRLKVPARLEAEENLTFVWETSGWRWNRWYNRTMIGAFVTGLFSRARASVRLKRVVTQRHREDPYDLIYQFSNIESLSVPSAMRRSVPLVIHPETHTAGELRFLLRERRLALRCQPLHTFLVAAATMALRSAVQRRKIRRASLLICISGVFRDHLVRDYRFPAQRTVVVPNPIQIERFAAADTGRPAGQPPVVLVLGRISVRKGVEDVVAASRLLAERGSGARIRVVGSPSLWSDYTALLDDLPGNAEFAGHLPPAEVPSELAHSDILLQASKYEPFALTVGEALASGVPVVATSEVGAIEGVDRSVVAEVAPGDVPGLADAIEEMLARLHADAPRLRAGARAEAERLFASDVVCDRISAALAQLVAGG